MVASTVIAKDNAISSNYFTVTPGKANTVLYSTFKYKKYIKGI
jgi:hypothetical protein